MIRPDSSSSLFGWLAVLGLLWCSCAAGPPDPVPGQGALQEASGECASDDDCLAELEVCDTVTGTCVFSDICESDEECGPGCYCDGQVCLPLDDGLDRPAVL